MLLKGRLNFGHDDVMGLLIASFAHTRRVLQLLLRIAMKQCFSRRSHWFRDGVQYHAANITIIGLLLLLPPPLSSCCCSSSMLRRR